MLTRVPLATPTRFSPREQSDVLAALERIATSDRWILGREVAAWEQEFTTYVGAGSVVGVGNGTDALAIAFQALEIEPGSDVLVCATDGGYSATAARMVGLNPVVIDVDADTLDPSPSTAEAGVTNRTRALVVTHLHGNAVSLEAIDAWRRQHGLLLIEDCAQAHGLRLAGRHVGGTGDAATFSFYPTKNLGAIGDAGAISFPEGQEGAAHRARSLRQYGWTERYLAAIPGGRNSRLDEIQAAVLRVRLPYLDARNQRRIGIHASYASAVATTGRARMLGEGASSVAHHAVVITANLSDRDNLRAYLDDRGIDTAVHYPWLVSEMPGLFPEPVTSHLPVSTSRRERILSVPCTPELTDDEASRVIEALKDWSKT